jgi:hypothetical protein
MANAGDIYLISEEYTKKHYSQYLNRIINKNKEIKKYEAQIEYLQHKIDNNEDIPNLQYLIDEKRKKIKYIKVKINEYNHHLTALLYIPKRKRVFLYLLRLININVAAEILKGGIYRFPYQVGKLYILTIKNYIGKNSINWNASFRNLNRIAKDKDPQLYEKYKNGELKHFEYIYAMKQYVYPTYGKQYWLVHNDDSELFTLRFKKGAPIVSDKSYFKFKPTNFINLPNKYADNHNKYFSDIDSLIYSNKLGFKNKIAVIKRFFKDFKYCYNGI